MEAVIRAAVLACVGTLSALIIRRGSPELASALAIAVCCACAFIAVRLFSPIASELERASRFSGLSPAVLAPVMKCAGIGVVSKIASGLCRDGGQQAMASAVELAGAAGALCAAMPLVSSLLDMLERLI